MTGSSPWTGSWSHAQTHTLWKLSEAQFLLLFLFLANHFNVAVLPHALPQFDGTATNVLPWTNTEGYKQAAVRETTVTVPGWDQIRASSSKMQQIPCNNSCSESSARVRRLTVHLSHGSHVIIWIFEAHKTVAFGFSSPFVSDHLVTHTVMMSCYPPTGDTRHFHREVD